MTWRRTLAYGLAAAVAATTVAAVSPSSLALVDLRVFDAIVRASRTRPPSGRVAIAAIDDRSLAEIGQWPWPRNVLARLLDRIRELGANVVAIDTLLAEPDRRGADASATTDAALTSTVAEGRVIVGYALTFGNDVRNDSGCMLHSIAQVLAERSDGSPVVDLFHANGVVCSLPELSRSAAGSGYLNASPDRDGLLRRVPLLMELHGAIYPSLALAAFVEATRSSRIELTALPGDRARLTIGGAGVPLDARGTLLIRFRGPRGTYPRLSAADILNGRVAADALRNRIVFVGATALGVQDTVSTPADTAMPGVEVHAAAVDTLLQGDFLSTPPTWRAYELISTMTVTLAAAGIVAVLGLFYGTIASAALVALVWWLTSAAVNASGVFLSPVFPTIGGALVLSVLTVARVGHERTRAEAERTRRERAHQFAVESLTSLMEARDSATGRHARRTQAYSRVLATRLAWNRRFRDELTPERVDLIARLSPLHDIGKVGVRDAVLNKAGALSADEIDEMRRHPGFGHSTIANAERLAGGEGGEALLQLAKDIIYTHHERWDGRGYPRGLKGEEIPVAGRIVALVDVYDALTNSRTYRTSLSHDEAVAMIRAGRDSQFDPDIVDAFLAVADRFKELSLAFRREAAHEGAGGV